MIAAAYVVPVMLVSLISQGKGRTTGGGWGAMAPTLKNLRAGGGQLFGGARGAKSEATLRGGARGGQDLTKLV